MSIKDRYNNFKDYDKLAREKYGTYNEDLIYYNKDYNGSTMMVNCNTHECICCGSYFTKNYYSIDGEHSSDCDFANGWANSNYAKNIEETLSYDEAMNSMFKEKENLYSLTILRNNKNNLEAYKNKNITNKNITNKIVVRTSQIVGGSFVGLMLFNLLLFHSLIFAAIVFGFEFIIAFGCISWFKHDYTDVEYGVYRDSYGRISAENIIKDNYNLLINDKESVEDIAKEYNSAVAMGNINNFKHIVDNISADKSGWKDYSANIITDYSIRIKSEFVKNNIKMVERYKDNPILSSLPLSDSVNASSIILTVDEINSLDSYLGEGEMDSVKSLIKRFGSMNDERANLNSFDVIKLDNCLAEFYVHYNKLLNKASSGEDITDDEVNTFMNVVDSCGVVLSIISPKLVEGRMDKLRISNMFLEDKFNLA